MKNLLLNSKIKMIAGIFLIAVLSFAFKVSTTPNKITICHVPPGNPGNCQEITVSINALEAHLNHGDDMVCNNEDESEAYSKIMHEYRMRVPSSQNEVLSNYAY